MKNKVIGLALVMGALSFLGPREAAAQTVTNPTVNSQLLFVNLLLNREAHLINVSISRFVQASSYATRLNALTSGYLRVYPNRAALVYSYFNAANLVYQRYVAQTAALNNQILLQEQNIQARLALIGSLAPTNPFYSQLSLRAQQQAAVASIVTTATPVAPTLPLG